MDITLARVKENDNFMKPVILIKKDKAELLTNSSLMLIKGEVGSGKSRLAMNMMKGLLTGKEDLNLEYIICPEDKYIVYISTEMSKYHLQRRLLKILDNVSEIDHNKLVFLDVSSFSVEERNRCIQNIVNVYPPHVILIDQLADFVTNINDIEQANQIITKLMNGIEKTDCAIIGIVHQNEDSGIQSKARGHLGSVFEQKVVSSIGISDNKKGFKIRTTKLREGSSLELNAKFNESTEMLIEANLSLNLDLSNLTYPITRESFINEIMKLEKCSERTAITRIEKLVEENYLIKNKQGKTVTYDLIQ